MEMPVRNSVLWLNSVIPFLGKTVRRFVKVGMSSFFPAPATFPSGHPPTHQLIMHTPALLAAVTLAASLTALPARAADPALTIYNQGFAVHRETVPLELKAGVNDVRFAGVTAQVEADSEKEEYPPSQFRAGTSSKARTLTPREIDQRCGREEARADTAAAVARIAPMREPHRGIYYQ